MIRKNPDRGSEVRWGLTAARSRRWQPASASPARPCRQLRGCPGPRQILAMAVKAQVKPAPVSCPRPGGPGVAREWGAGQPSGAGPGIASRPDPVAGIDRDTVRAPAADPGRRQVRAARHLARVPGRRLMPAPETARGKPADRAGKTGHSLAPPPAQSPPDAHSGTLSGLDIPVVCARRSRRGTEGN
jgi:hypothetical protein